jgi:pyruvate/2-oxoglutarate dehydrogenase complex dihydrolipoamide dehydrogenase (E3) component
MDYDVIVIGAGQAGSPLACRLSADGRRTLLVEREHVGGTCVNVGCTPTKTMVASARAAHVARRAGRLGVEVQDVRVDLGAVVDRKDEIVRSFRSGLEERLEKTENLTLVAGAGRFTGPRELEIDGVRHRADTVVVNAGARPSIPPITGLDRLDWLDSTTIMELREVPEHLVVLGGGYIGCEFGQMFRRFGSEVTIVNQGSHLLDREDEDVSEAIEGVFLSEGISLRLGAPAKGVSRRGTGRTAVGAARARGARSDRVVLELEEGPPIEGSHLLVAVGRVPNTEDLDCEAAGIELDRRGYIKVDDFYRTSAEGVYAVGDVTGGPQFTHTSWDDHRILYEILQGKKGRGRSDRLVPYTVFTDPQVARVGLSEREAKEKGIVYEVATLPFGSVARAIELDETAGTMKVLLDPETEHVLGAAIVGIEAGELIHIFVILMQAGATARAIVEAEAVHPTLAEGVQSLVMTLPRYSLG